MNPNVVSVIPGGQSGAQMESNLRAAEANIPPALWTDLKAQGLMREDAATR
jgi:D-threo-aldose 1-dehydrogenase